MFASLLRTGLILFLLGAQSVWAASYGSVGGVPIDGKNVDRWVQYMQVNPGPGQFKDMRFFGVAQEIKKLLNLAMLKKLGVKIDQKDLDEYATIKANEPSQKAFFDKLFEVTGKDRKTFVDSFFLYPYTEDLLQHDVFTPAKSNEFNKDLEGRINVVAKKLAVNPALFAETGRVNNYEIKEVTASVSGGIRLTDEKRFALSIASSVPAKEMEDAAKLLKEGSVNPVAIANYQYFMIIKAKGKKGDEYLLDAMLVPKKGYQDWFWAQAGKIPVKITDKKIRKEVKERAPWAVHLNLK
jgi:hypothetical protein